VLDLAGSGFAKIRIDEACQGSTLQLVSDEEKKFYNIDHWIWNQQPKKFWRKR